MKKLRIRDCHIITMNDQGEQIPGGEVVLEGDRVAYVGKVRERPGDGEFDRVIRARGHLCLPGFINTHTHLAMTLFRGLANDLPLDTWLKENMFPLEAGLRGEDVYWGTLLSLLEMIKSGTTTINDMYFFMDRVGEALGESGVRGVLSQSLHDNHGKGKGLLAKGTGLIQGWNGRGQGRIKTMLAPHSPYACSPAYLQEIRKVAREYRVPVKIHLAESAFEVRQAREKYGLTPVEYLDSLGFFEGPTIAVHCVQVNQKDIGILAERGVNVVHNPGSNLKLGNGFAPVPRMLEAGVNVSLGTDGAASNNNLDMLEEVRLAALIHKGLQEDPTVLPAYRALEMATRSGADCLFQGGDTGRLQPGHKGDLVLLDLDKPHFYPRHDLVAHLVYAAQASDVDTVIVDGNILMEKREMKSLDEEKIKYQAEKHACDLLARVQNRGVRT